MILLLSLNQTLGPHRIYQHQFLGGLGQLECLFFSDHSVNESAQDNSMWYMLSPKSKMAQQALLILLSRDGGRVRSSNLPFLLEGSCPRPDFQKT